MGYLLTGILLGLIPAMIARSKGRNFLTWWVYGALLSIVALPHALLLTAEIKQIEQQQLAQGLKKCPFCAEMIKPDALVCRYCSRDLPDNPAAPALATVTMRETGRQTAREQLEELRQKGLHRSA